LNNNVRVSGPQQLSAAWSSLFTYRFLPSTYKF
jgi:hypothetical protein